MHARRISAFLAFIHIEFYLRVAARFLVQKHTCWKGVDRVVHRVDHFALLESSLCYVLCFFL